MLYLDHRAGTQPHEMFGRFYKVDAHREALRYPHPIH
jgi:hypothetical protein